MIDKTLSKAEAQRIFSENAVLYGIKDTVPFSIAVGLVGKDAVNYVIKFKDTDEHFYCKWRDRIYLTQEGFYFAVTFHNSAILDKIEKGERENLKIRLEKKARFQVI